MKKFNNRKKIKINKETRSEYNFKEVSLTKMAKRQLFVTLFSILGVTIISLGSAYAVFTSVSKSADYNVIKVGTLNIDFGADIYAEDSSGENILMLAEKINNEEIINIITKEYENGF